MNKDFNLWALLDDHMDAQIQTTNATASATVKYTVIVFISVFLNTILKNKSCFYFCSLINYFVLR